MSRLNGRLAQLEKRVPMTQHDQILTVMRDCPPLPHEAAGARRFLFDAECSTEDAATFDGWFNRVDALTQLDRLGAAVDAHDDTWLTDLARLIVDGNATRAVIERLWPDRAEQITALVETVQ